MNKFIKVLVPVAALLAVSQARALPFEPSFADYSFPGTQYTVDAAANAFFSSNYGITISNAYLYKDSRDTFDGVGVSAGTVAEIGSFQTGRIDFLDSTNFISLDYFTLDPTTYSIFDTHGNLIQSVSFGGNLNATYLFSVSGRIGALTWASTGGFGQVTGLRYDYDGKTDGTNVDIDGPRGVPDAFGTGLMLALGVGFFAALRRRLTQ